MPDVRKAARYRRQFIKWLGINQAKVDEQYIASAIAISEYVDSSHLASIQLELSSESAIYKAFKHRNLAALIYGILALSDYFQQCNNSSSFTDGEQEVVANLIAKLKTMYEKPRSDTATKFQGILFYANLWLDGSMIQTSNPALLKKTLIALYTMLKFLDTKLATLNPAEQAALYLASIDSKESKTAIEGLLDKTARNITTLTRILAARSDAERQPAGPKTIEDFFKAHFLKLIDQENFTLIEKLAFISETLNQARDTITELIAEKTKAASIQSQMQHALILWDAIDQNEQNIFGKKYALALINAHRASFDDLMLHSTDDERADWLMRLAQLEAPDRTRRAKDLTQYALSWATFLSTAAYRKWAPESLKKRFEGYFSLSTFDGECKIKLRELTLARLTTLQKAIATSNIATEEIITRLSDDQPQIKALFLAATRQQLKELVDNQREIQQVIWDYSALCNLVTMNQGKLHRVQGLNQYVDFFIKNHDSFWIQLSLFFSKISDLFKTANAAKVQAVQTIKSELKTLKAGYEHNITEGLEEISGNRTISPEIKDALVVQLSITKPIAPITPRSSNIVSEYRHVKTLFAELTATLPQAINADDKREPAPRRTG